MWFSAGKLLSPGRGWVLLAVAASLVIYLPALGYGIVKYDDAWLVRDNWIVQTLSWSSVETILFDLDSPARYTLAPEYLPVRDLSVMLDFALWGERYAGFHLTNLALYLAAIGLWFALLIEFGVEHTVAGIALALWAVHPAHAESVAWLAERKGLLGMMFSGVAGFAFARFRAGRADGWLALAMLSAPCAVWSKAHAAFALAALAAFELVWPARRVSWRRSLLGLGCIAGVSLLAFAPVVWLATHAAVVGDEVRAPAGRSAMVLGVHGFYLRLAAGVLDNALSYPISTLGPSRVELGLGGAGLLAVLALAVLPARGRFRPPADVRGAAWLWIAGWLPVSHLILPLQMVFVADRYLLLPSMGLALGVAALLARIPTRLPRAATVSILLALASARASDARASWSSPIALWARAVDSNPDDGVAWSMYAEALADSGDLDLAAEVVDRGLARTRHSRLLLRSALLRLERGDRSGGRARMREAAVAGDGRAMSNHALLLLEDGEIDDALTWARRGVAAMNMYAPALRALGRVALAAKNMEEARSAFRLAFELEPRACTNRFNLALTELELQRPEAAREYVAPCARDPKLGTQSRAMLAEIARREALSAAATNRRAAPGADPLPDRPRVTP